MYIKTIIIQGFKTYKDRTVIDSLSPHSNAIVGKNGSGKSNFFAAIRFVLSDAYTQMSREERQGLIHEGSGTIMSAYVEVVFDNTDRRFPIESDEVSIRRTIGLKKDDYSIDHKSAQRLDIMNLLESAGFSRSNPYYIVPQGRVTALTNAKDKERLELLKQVAGAVVFEEKHKQSVKEMSQSDAQKDKIDEMLGFIDERLQDLSVEKLQLKQYQELDRDKKVYEYTLYNQEIGDLQGQIEEIESQHMQEVDGSNEYSDELDKSDDTAMQVEEILVELTSKLNALQVDKQQQQLDLNAQLEQFAQQQVLVANKKGQETNQRELLATVQQEITAAGEAIEATNGAITALETSRKKLQDELAIVTVQHKEVYLKQSRMSRFKDKKQRDDWLKNSIESMQEKVSQHERELAKLQSQEASLAKSIGKLDLQIDTLNARITQDDQQELELGSKIADLKNQYLQLIDQRKNLWRDEAKQHSIIESSEEELKKANSHVNETMDGNQSQGLDAVKRITEKLGLVGVYGPLGELIEVNPKYKIAAEVVAGNSLFNIVVDNDKTASIIMDELIREKSGRVTFIPLNRLPTRTYAYPERSDCIPLIKKISYDDTFEPIIKQIYGSVVVTVSLEVGSLVSKQYKLSAITLDGDKIDARGVLFGGYREHRRLRLDSLIVQQRRKSELKEARQELHEITRKIERVNGEITALNSSMKNLQIQYDSHYKELLAIELESLKNRKLSLRHEAANLQLSIESNSRILNQYNQQNENYKAELQEEFQQEISTDRLEQLKQQLLAHNKDLEAVIVELNAKKLQLVELDSMLNDTLIPRQQNLASDVAQLNLQNMEVEQLNKLKKSIEQTELKIADNVKEHDSLTKQIESKQKLFNKIQDIKRSLIKKLSGNSKLLEKNITKKALLLTRRDDMQKKIRDLGILPGEAFEDSITNDADVLIKKLNAVNKKLLKYNHINKKAIEQYLNFSKQQSDLINRRKELDNSKQSIENLIQVLQERKGNAINRTFEELSTGFSEIFEKLVPSGQGKLVLQKPSSFDSQTLTQLDSSEDQIDKYTGISIEVSFNSKSDEQQKIEQLSGGQKSLCAIALILAIQKIDPGPFYLFDEVDSNLDAQYRTSVASLIAEMSRKSQFICTSFKPEILQVADKFYGIEYNNKISRVEEIDKEEAMLFVGS